MFEEKFFRKEESKQPETPICPEGHENPCAWSNACSYCDAICKREKEDAEKLNLIRKGKKVDDPDSYW